MAYCEVPRPEPSARKRLRRRHRIVQVPHHRHVPPHNNLADRLSIRRHIDHRFGVDHADRVRDDVVYSLTRDFFGEGGGVEGGPGGLGEADGGWAEGFGEAVKRCEGLEKIGW